MKLGFKFLAISLTLFGALCFAMPAKNASAAPATFWQNQCIDTMKDSRDNARGWAGRSDLPQLVVREVAAIKNTGANCVAIGTPYDDEFGPYMKVWVDEIHKQGLRVWFRGNVSGWEGWFDYPILKNVADHHLAISHFITFHPTFFKDGDIFTPAPEPEAGKLIGDPRNSDAAQKQYFKFLIDSYNNCLKSFSQIDVKVQCGYFSTNGDIAKYVLTKDLISKIGNIVVVDHYVADPNVLVGDLVFLHNKFNAQIMLGEFGAPIPDLNGNMTEQQQADFIDAVFNGLVKNQNFIIGVNYWTLTDSSSAIYNSDLTPRKAVNVLKNYYTPAVMQGTVTSSTGNKVSGASVKLVNGSGEAISDKNGQFSLPLPAGHSDLEVSGNSYKPQNATITAGAGQQISKNFVLEPQNLGWWARFWNSVKSLFK